MEPDYTDPIRKGEVEDFNTFAIQCAQHFSVHIEMRDDPVGAPIPDEFEPSDFSKKLAEKAKARLEEVESCSDAEILRMAYAERRRERQQVVEANRCKNVEKKRCLDMLGKVIMWDPPSEGHEDLKNFMINQLTQSIRTDCRPLQDDTSRGAINGRIYRAEKTVEARSAMNYHLRQYDQEVARVKEKNQWVRQLRKSLIKER